MIRARRQTTSTMNDRIVLVFEKENKPLVLWKLLESEVSMHNVVGQGGGVKPVPYGAVPSGDLRFFYYGRVSTATSPSAVAFPLTPDKLDGDKVLESTDFPTLPWSLLAESVSSTSDHLLCAPWLIPVHSPPKEKVPQAKAKPKPAMSGVPTPAGGRNARKRLVQEEEAERNRQANAEAESKAREEASKVAPVNILDKALLCMDTDTIAVNVSATKKVQITTPFLALNPDITDEEKKNSFIPAVRIDDAHYIVLNREEMLRP